MKLRKSEALKGFRDGQDRDGPPPLREPARARFCPGPEVLQSCDRRSLRNSDSTTTHPLPARSPLLQQPPPGRCQLIYVASPTIRGSLFNCYESSRTDLRLHLCSTAHYVSSSTRPIIPELTRPRPIFGPIPGYPPRPCAIICCGLKPERSLKRQCSLSIARPLIPGIRKGFATPVHRNISPARLPSWLGWDDELSEYPLGASVAPSDTDCFAV